MEEERLARHELFHGHDYEMKSAEELFRTEVLFIDSVQMQLIPENDHLKIKARYDGPIGFLIDGHATHSTPRVAAYAGS
jgi:hypothetical protein